MRALREGTIVGLANSTVLIARDGTERPIDDSAAPIRDEGGTRAGAILVFRDVTERRAAEAALRRKEAELRDFVENATVGLHWVGPDGTILWANRAELELLGYAKEEYVGRNIVEFHVDRPVIDDILRRLLNKEEIRGCEARLRCKDGSVKHVLINSSGLWEGERFLHTRCFTHDITDRKRAEEAQARLAAIVESSDDAIVSKTLDAIITSWNQGAERLFGYTAAEAVGRPITLIIPPERLDEEPAILERLRRGERVEHFETVRVAKDGRRLDISLTISPVRDGGGPHHRRLEDRARHHRPEAGGGRLAGAGAAAARGGRGGADHPLGGLARQRPAGHRGRGEENPRRPPGGRQPDVGDDCGQVTSAVSTSEATSAGASPASRLPWPMHAPRSAGPTGRCGSRGPSWRPTRRRSNERKDATSLPCVAGWPPRSSAAAARTWELIEVSDKDDGDFSESDEAVLVQLAHIASVAIENARLYGELREQDRRKDEFLALLAHELRNPLAPLRNGLQVMRLAGDVRQRSRPNPGHDGAAARPHGAADRRPARRLAHQPQQDGAAPLPSAARRRGEQRRGDGPPRHRGGGPRAHRLAARRSRCTSTPT